MLLGELAMDKELLERYLPPDTVRFGEQMSSHTSLHIGGPADAYITPVDIESLANIYGFLHRHGCPSLPFGGGTNVLVRDSGIKAIVISTSNIKGMSVLEEDRSSIILRLMAGHQLQALISYCKAKGLSGAEGLSGIPGTIGGAVAGNAGAFGHEIKDILREITLVMPDGGLATYKREDFNFGYRKATLPDKSVIVRATVQLKKADQREVSERIASYLKDKSLSQPIGKRSAGCVFKNPKGLYAGKLIDEAGCKGMSIGGIAVSTLHANFFLNREQGTASDFMRLMDAVTGKVKAASGVVLEPEIKILGDD